MDDLKLYLFHAEDLWFKAFDKHLFQSEETRISSNFDYHELFDGTKRIYIDIGFEFDYAEIMFRSGIEFNGNKITWREVFTHYFLFKLVNAAVENSYQDFSDKCDELKIDEYSYFEINEKIPHSITDSIINQYDEYRSVSDREHEIMLNTIGLECETGSDTILVFKCVFAVLDEVLINNSHFNTERNQDVFDNIIPLPQYFTLRYTCLTIEYQDVQLSIYHTILFLQCLDCALQVLLGDKADDLIPALEDKGINKEVRTEFFKLSTEHFSQLREMLRTSNARILNLEETHDWSSLLR